MLKYLPSSSQNYIAQFQIVVSKICYYFSLYLQWLNAITTHVHQIALHTTPIFYCILFWFSKTIRTTKRASRCWPPSLRNNLLLLRRHRHHVPLVAYAVGLLYKRLEQASRQAGYVVPNRPEKVKSEFVPEPSFTYARWLPYTAGELWNALCKSRRDKWSQSITPALWLQGVEWCHRGSCGTLSMGGQQVFQCVWNTDAVGSRSSAWFSNLRRKFRKHMLGVGHGDQNRSICGHGRHKN